MSQYTLATLVVPKLNGGQGSIAEAANGDLTHDHL